MTFCVDQFPHSATHHGCRNTRDLVHAGIVPKSFCNRCPYRLESLGDFFQQTSRLAARTKTTRKPQPCKPCGNKKQHPRMSLSVNGEWFVVVTTSPRIPSTLQQCVDSLRWCGWEPVIFAEPNSQQVDVGTICNTERLGVWNNWLNACRHALQTDAKYILTAQDDAVFHPDSRTFAESILWPSHNVGCVSMYTPAHYSDGRQPGVNKIVTRSLWGACALVWPRDVLQQVIEHPYAKKWRGASGRDHVEPHEIQNADTAIGEILYRMGREMWFVDPSPVYHAAATSTIGHGGNSGRRNCGRCADHSKPLRQQVFPDEPTESKPS